MKDPELNFYLTKEEFIFQILGNISKITDIDPMIIFEIYDLLKPIKVKIDDEYTDDVAIKLKIMLEQFVGHMQDAIDIGYIDNLNNFYTILNNYSYELSKHDI